MRESTILYRLQTIREKKNELRRNIRKRLRSHEEAMCKLSKREIRLMEALGKIMKEQEEEKEEPEKEETEYKDMRAMDIETMRDLKRRANKGEISQFSIMEIEKQREEWLKRERENSRKEVNRYFDNRDKFVKEKNGICRVKGCTNNREQDKTMCKEHTKYYKRLKRKQNGNRY